MKYILFLLLFLPVLAYAQFPASPNKIRLGNQTTADGLVVRTAASPSWTPSTINNAWLAFDTVAVKLYYYDGGAWNEYTGGSEITDVSVSNDTLYITTTDSTFVAVFDDANTNFANSNLTFTGNRVHNLSTRTLTIADGGTYPTFLQSSATDVISMNSSAKDYLYSSPGLVEVGSDAQLNILADDTITVTASRIRLNAADTRVQQVSKDNALNRVMMLDSLTGQVYYRDVSSIAGGGGTVTGTGTTNTLPKWTSSTALGNSLITDDGTNVAVGGTASFRLPNGTTAQRPGSPAAGMMRYNTTNNAMEYHAGTFFEVPVKGATLTGLGTAGRVFFGDAAGRAATGNLFWDSTNDRISNTYDATIAPIPARFTSINEGVSSAGMAIAQFSNTFFHSATFSQARARGTAASPTAVQFRDILCLNGTVARGATSWTTDQGFWGAIVDTIPTGNNVPLAWVWTTESPQNPATSPTYIAKMTLASNGNFGIGNFGAVTGSHTRPPNKLTIHGNASIGENYTGTAPTNGLIVEGNVGIGNNSPSRTLHVTGEARITDLTTDTPTRIVGADADGDLGAITVGTGLSLTAGTLTATAGAAGTTNLAFSGTSSPVTLTSDTGTDVIFAAGSGLALSQSGGTATYSRTYSLTHITISGGSTFFGTTAERPDNDTPGSATTSTVGSDFSVSGSTINYTGGSGALLRVEGSISFSVADDGDYYLSIYKEGSELGATSMRVSCVAGNYYSISLPATTTSGSTNDTFDLRIATVTGNSTTTMHRYGFILERIY